MNNNEELIEGLEWNNNIKNKEEKEVLARKIASKVKDGDVISFGSGTTSFLAVKEIAKKCQKDDIKIKAVTTSKQIELLCNYLKIPTVQLGECSIDWGFDGADEVDKNNWLIKGLGGALFREKMNLKRTPIVYILVDRSKLVNRLGEKCMIPIECEKEHITHIQNELKKIGAIFFEIRKEKNSDKYYVTDNNNYIIDAKFKVIDEKLEYEINQIDGVVENGLFINYKNIEIIIS